MMDPNDEAIVRGAQAIATGLLSEHYGLEMDDGANGTFVWDDYCNWGIDCMNIARMACAAMRC